jgi:hypothetical protein
VVDVRRAGAYVEQLVECGEVRQALKLLEQERRQALGSEDVEALRHVLEAARLVHGHAEQGDRNRAARVIYAAQQNIRFLTRKQALTAGEEWVDPFTSPSPPGSSLPKEVESASLSDNDWLSAQLGTWAGLLVGTLAAAFAGAVVGAILGLIVWFSGGGTTATYVLLVLPPVTACEYVGFVCRRWWAFTGSVSLLPWFLLAWAAGGDLTFMAGAFACVTGALAIGSLLGSAFNRSRRQGKRTPDSDAVNGRRG